MVELSTDEIRELKTREEIIAAVALALYEPHVASYASLLIDVAEQQDMELWGFYKMSVLAGYLVLAHGIFDAEIESVAVLPAIRGQGVGRALVTHACDRAKALGRERILLEVRESNQAAITVYTQCGFVQDGVRRAYYDPLPLGGARENAVLMSCALTLA